MNRVARWPPLFHPSPSHSPHIPLVRSPPLKPALVRPRFPLWQCPRSASTPRQSRRQSSAASRWRSRARPLAPPPRRPVRCWELSSHPSGVSVCGEARWWFWCRSWEWPQLPPCSSWRRPRQGWGEQKESYNSIDTQEK